MLLLSALGHPTEKDGKVVVLVFGNWKEKKNHRFFKC